MEKLDNEWMELIEEALELGMTVQDLENYFNMNLTKECVK